MLPPLPRTPWLTRVWLHNFRFKPSGQSCKERLPDDKQSRLPQWDDALATWDKLAQDTATRPPRAPRKPKPPNERGNVDTIFVCSWPMFAEILKNQTRPHALVTRKRETNTMGVPSNNHVMFPLADPGVDPQRFLQNRADCNYAWRPCSLPRPC